MKRIPRNNVVYSFSPDNPPVERAKPGDTVVFETLDALGGQVRDEATPINRIDWNRVNPATGPLYVEGAEPGDTLVVRIKRIAVSDTGVILVVPGYGALPEAEFEPRVRLVRVSGGRVLFRGIGIEARPMIGTIGVAPPEGRVPTGDLGRHGGNMDAAVVGEGATLYLPVFVEGALLALGDLHAVQGDGEVCVAAAEVSGEVEVELGLVKRRSPPWPLVEFGDRVAVLVAGGTLDEAVEEATRVAVAALMRSRGLDFADAYMLASLVVDLRINQVVDPKKGVRAEIPKRYVDVESFLR